jgi:hypothetical protein
MTVHQYAPIDDGSGLYRRNDLVICDWVGFNNLLRMTHWMPIPPPPVLPVREVDIDAIHKTA